MTTVSQIHRFVPGPDATATPLLLLHGTGGDENDLIPLGRALAPTAALLSPRGVAEESGMPRFFHRLAPGVFDPAEIDQRAAAFAAFLRDARRRHGIHQLPLVAVGYSNGANMAAALLQRHPEAIDAAILLRPMVLPAPDVVADLKGKHLLILAGRNDPIVPADDPGKLAAAFRRAGASVTLHTVSGGHQLGADDLAMARAFLADRSQADRPA